LPRVVCAYCGSFTSKLKGEINRAKKQGASIYCDRKCAGLGRRKHTPDWQLKEKKRLYDIEYRERNKEKIQLQKKLWFKKSYEPKKAAEIRARRKEEHPEQEKARREYMSSKEYKERKRKYDEKYRAFKYYGEEWGECFLLCSTIRSECLSRSSDYEIRLRSQTLNKWTRRRREYEKAIGAKHEGSSLGNLE
jgi:hypothetical protein